MGTRVHEVPQAGDSFWHSLKRRDESIREVEGGQQFRETKKADLPGALKPPQRRDRDTAFLGEIDLPEALRQTMATNGVSYNAQQVSFGVK